VPAFADREADWGYYYGWSRSYTLTPMEHKRLRARGHSDKEVYAIANIANLSGRHVDDVLGIINAGPSAYEMSNRTGLTVEQIYRPRPEWKTPAWEEAVKRGDYFWIPPRM
jgi:hypothetical protein